jgi:hypothetical protein
METLTAEQLIQHIQKLSEAEKSQLAKQILPMLLRTKGVSSYFEKLSDAELNAIVEQVRERNKHFKEEEVADVLYETLQEVRASSRA